MQADNGKWAAWSRRVANPDRDRDTQRTARVAGIAIVAMMFAAIQPVFAAGLDPTVQQQVRAATFEVVVAKPVDDPLTYEKPLPLELLSFQYRNDKYFSIGTAFAIDGGRYVTAAHVLGITLGGLWGAPALRDTTGHVYPIDRIEKYSAHEDFVVFTLAMRPTQTTTLQVDRHPVLNEPVYSVGNALGEGVVIRDGLYTSDTPENQDGRWKWLRFSAAASPGNSGGPLLDKDGKVIGVVLMKSPNENLNFAVSMDQVLQAPEHIARIDTRAEFRIDVFDKVKTIPFKQEFSLPKTYADFAATYLKLRDEFNTRGLHDLKSENADTFFPNGPGSSKLLHGLYEKVVPALIVRGENEQWNFDSPRYTRADVGNGGSVDSARARSELLIRLRKPDDVKAADLYRDPELYARLVLKGMPLYRQVGTDKVKIVALGKPIEDSTFADSWGRTWQLREWALAYDNTVLISLDLPVPDGYVSIRRVAFAGVRTQQIEQLKTIADFVALAFGGTLQQWRDFLAVKNVVPHPLSASAIDFDYGRRFTFKSQHLSFAVTPELQKIDKESHLVIDIGFVSAAGKATWDIQGIALHADSEGKTEVGAFRHSAPSEDLDDGMKKSWNKRLRHEHPFDAVAFQEQDFQYIRAVFGPVDPQPVPDVLYTFVYRAEAGTPQDVMKAKLDLLLRDAHVDLH